MLLGYDLFVVLLVWEFGLAMGMSIAQLSSI